MRINLLSKFFPGKNVDVEFKLKYFLKEQNEERKVLDKFTHRFPLFCPDSCDSNFKYVWIPYINGSKIFTAAFDVASLKNMGLLDDFHNFNGDSQLPIDLDLFIFQMWLKSIKIEVDEAEIKLWRDHYPRRTIPAIDEKIALRNIMDPIKEELKTKYRIPSVNALHIMLYPLVDHENPNEKQKVMKILLKNPFAF